MPKRLQISDSAHDWTVNVSGHEITLVAGEAPMTVARADGRLRVEGGEAITGAAAASAPLIGDAIAAGDVVWVTVRGEVFAFTVTHGAKKVRSESRDHDAFTPPMSATVVRIAVKPGDAVQDGDVLIALEAMKMELPIRAPRNGVVKAIHCQPGELVQPGHVLLELE